jgi:hypothetical protein
VNAKFVRIILVMAAAIPALVGANAFSGPIFAQDRAEGEFKLSEEVRWADSILPKGEYVYSVDSGRSPMVVQVRQKDGSFSGTFTPQAFLKQGYEGPSGVFVERIGGEAFVTSLRVQGLKLQLDFPVQVLKEKARPADANYPLRKVVANPLVLGFFTILNPDHEKISIAETEKIYLSACEAVEREFDRSDPVRPRLTLMLGASEDFLRYQTREVLLKKWDKYLFAEAVVGLAMNDLASPGERVRLSKLAVSQADATVDLCQLKNCKN